MDAARAASAIAIPNDGAAMPAPATHSPLDPLRLPDELPVQVVVPLYAAAVQELSTVLQAIRSERSWEM